MVWDDGVEESLWDEEELAFGLLWKEPSIIKQEDEKTHGEELMSSVEADAPGCRGSLRGSMDSMNLGG